MAGTDARSPAVRYRATVPVTSAALLPATATGSYCTPSNVADQVRRVRSAR